MDGWAATRLRAFIESEARLTGTAAQRPWAAPRARHPVVARITLPGSKSMTNRALVLGALGSGRCIVRRPLRSRDTELMAAGLGVLGVRVTDVSADGGCPRPEGADRPSPEGDNWPSPEGDNWPSPEGDNWIIDATGEPLQPVGAAVDVGNAGTVARFLPAVAGFAVSPVTFDGDARVHDRPVAALWAALRALGVDIDDAGTGRLPVTVRGSGRIAGGAVDVDASTSSQILSALMLVGPRCTEGLRLSAVGDFPSRPHVAMTIEMLRAAGAVVESDRSSWRIAPGLLHSDEILVEPDLSGAAPFLAAAMVTGGRVQIDGWPSITTQPGALLLDLFEQMGARIERLDGAVAVTGPENVRGVDADLSDCGELAPVVAAVAALATTPSRLAGIAHLRGHETDRLAALSTELCRLGAVVSVTLDGLAIEPRPLHGDVFHTYDDHRLAMAGAVLGLVVDDIVLDDVATTAKTMPDFADRWAALLADDGSASETSDDGSASETSNR